MGGATLRTRLRQIKEHDIQVAQDSPPPPTFTVPAFRARNHRGGESELLKYTYPSGFCKCPENHPLPTTTTTSTKTAPGRNTLSLSGPQLRDLLHESKEVGVPPCGAVAGRQALNITRVVVGAKDLVDTVGSELVQFAGFSIGPAELSSPTSINRTHHLRPRTPSPVSPSRMTIDGSALLRGRSSLLVEARSAVNQWSGRKTCASDDFSSPRDESNAWKGRKRVRSATTDRAHSSGGPGPWPYPAETLTGRSSRPSTSASTKNRGGSGGVAAAAALRVHNGGGSEQPRDRPSGGREDPARPVSQDNATKHGTADSRDQNIQSQIPTCTGTANIADQERDFPGVGAQGISCSVQKEGQADCRNETAERIEGQVAPLLSEHEPNGGGRVDGAWAKDFPCPSVWSDGSTCFVASVSTNDDSAEQVAGKRSFSTLDTERYQGSLSKDATNILRSHLESRHKPPSNNTSCASDSRNAMATEGTALMSPAPPPTPPGQPLDNLLAGGAQNTTPHYFLPPLGRAPEACYVRTRSDIVLAVVRKKELLECDDDAGLRTLKTAARPVRIKADMSMTEGIRAILASGVLKDYGAVDECDRLLEEGGRGNRRRDCRSSRAGAADGTRSTRGRSRVLEYFDSQEGAWQLVRNESDWKVLLAAQSSPQGAGVLFHAAGANERCADFLVAVSPLETRANGRDESRATTTWQRHAPKKIKAALARAAKENRIGWRYASLVTPGALRSLGPSAGRDRDSGDRVVVARTPRGTAGRDAPETQRKGARLEGDSPAMAGPVPFPGETDPEAVEDGDDFRRRLAGLEGGKRTIGPGPGGALWVPTSRATVGRGAAGSPSRRPKKAKVRRLVRHLEVGLKLKGRPGAGGLPAVGSQRVDLPYTKELAKWSYDEILGIPKTTVPVRPPEL